MFLWIHSYTPSTIPSMLFHRIHSGNITYSVPVLPGYSSVYVPAMYTYMSKWFLTQNIMRTVPSMFWLCSLVYVLWFHHVLSLGYFLALFRLCPVYGSVQSNKSVHFCKKYDDDPDCWGIPAGARVGRTLVMVIMIATVFPTLRCNRWKYKMQKNTLQVASSNCCNLKKKKFWNS